MCCASESIRTVIEGLASFLFLWRIPRGRALLGTPAFSLVAPAFCPDFSFFPGRSARLKCFPACYSEKCFPWKRGSALSTTQALLRDGPNARPVQLELSGTDVRASSKPLCQPANPLGRFCLRPRSESSRPRVPFLLL